MLEFNFPISRAAIAIRPELIRKRAISLRKDYNRYIKTLFEHEDVVIVAERLRHKYPKIVRQKYGARPVSIGHNCIFVYCTVNHWSDAAPILKAFKDIGLKVYRKPRDEKIDMSRTLSLGRSKYDTIVILTLYLSESATECAVIIKEYIESEPTPVYEIVCNEEEAELKTAPDGLWRE